MKQILSVVFALAMAGTLAGCGDNDNSASRGGSSSGASSSGTAGSAGSGTAGSGSSPTSPGGSSTQQKKSP